MKCLNITRFAAALVAALVCASSPGQAAEMANPTGFSYYGYGNGSFGYGGVNAAPGMTGPALPSFASYPGYAGYPNAGYGYGGYGGYGNGGYGYGGYGACGGAGCGRHGHHCSFGGNSGCCNGVWDGYCGGGYGGGCCAPPIKVHRRHRPLGWGAGPCVDAACGAAAGCGPACHGRVHRCHLRRYQNWGYAPAGCDGCADGGGTTVDPAQTPTQQPAATGTEQLEAPMPTFETDEPPAPAPSDNSST
ncbi:MAG TPA: hypothetical protein VNH11_23510 [Pirellulales bacterium]|nr:hypothetical protein [Pirellulales bacterium]